MRLRRAAERLSRSALLPAAGARCPRQPECAGSLLVAVRYPATVEVVRRELDLHPVAGENADVVAAHLARDVPKYLVVVVELDLEHGVGQGLGDLALHLDLFFLTHSRRRA